MGWDIPPTKNNDARTIGAANPLRVMNKADFYKIMTLSEVALSELIKLRRNASTYHPTLTKFVNQFKGLCIDIVLVWFLFFCLGIPTVVRYGYSFETDRHKYFYISFLHYRLGSIPKSMEGSIPAGVYGSGVFPYTLFLFVVATTFFVKELV